MKYSLNPHIFVFGKTIKKPKISISFFILPASGETEYPHRHGSR